MIEYDGQEIRTNVTRKYSGEQTQTPIVGSIPCGSPQYEEENIEEYVSLPTAIFGKGDFFILRASGQSMIEAGIDDGDLVVVKKQVEANEGDIVVALVDKMCIRDRQHTLIQTISRVNRVCEGKDKGLIVDYIGIKKNMNTALKKYTNFESEEFEGVEQSITIVKDQLEVLGQMFHNFNSSDFFNGSPTEQLACLNRAVEYVPVSYTHLIAAF